MRRRYQDSRRQRACAGIASVAGALALSAGVAGVLGDSGVQAAAKKPVKIAYLSFAVANSYDAAMLAAGQAAARSGGATITVFDANDRPATQLAQLRTVSSSHRYDAIVVQPIVGTGLIGTVRAAIKGGVRVVNLDQELEPNLSARQPRLAGLAGNVVFVASKIGTKLGKLTLGACKTLKLNPCRIGFLHNIRASALDGTLSKAFDAAIAGRAGVSIAAEGQDLFTPSVGLSAVQAMLHAEPEINLIVGSDQGIEGALQAVTPGKVVLIGYGGSAAAVSGVASGAWYGDVAQLPASEGRDAVRCAIRAVRTGMGCGRVDPVAALSGGGVLTKANVHRFHAEWGG